jgi:hypothetical protein
LNLSVADRPVLPHLTLAAFGSVKDVREERHHRFDVTDDDVRVYAVIAVADPGIFRHGRIVADAAITSGSQCGVVAG